MEEDNKYTHNAKWGANPDDEHAGESDKDGPRVGAENIWFKMPKEDGTMMDVNLLQVINQVFVDMGHFDMRLSQFEAKEEEESPIVVA